MTSSDMNRLADLYREIETRLERGECASPELARLFAEASKLQSGEDVWCNLDPKGMSDLTRLGADFGQDVDVAPSSVAGWR